MHSRQNQDPILGQSPFRHDGQTENAPPAIRRCATSLKRAQRPLVISGALLLSALASAPCYARVVEKIVAVVNDEILLLSQLNERLQPLVSQLNQIPDPDLRKQRRKQLERQMLDHMIDEQLINQEAVKLKIEVTEQDLELAVKEMMRKNNLSRKQMEEALLQEGKSIEEYKYTIIRPQLIRLRVINIQVRSRISVSDEEIKALYQKNMRALGVETKVQARHIFIALPQNASEHIVAEKEAQAKSLLAKTKEPKADFAALAKQYSDDEATKADGGDLGLFGRGTLPANIEDVVFKLKKGEIAGPLRSEQGFHLIQVVDRQESSARPLEVVSEELREQLYGSKMEKATQGWVQEVRKRSHIDTRL
jgi:parvulin-like peptidyl-prolyl isomerase